MNDEKEVVEGHTSRSLPDEEKCEDEMEREEAEQGGLAARVVCRASDDGDEQQEEKNSDRRPRCALSSVQEVERAEAAVELAVVGGPHAFGREPGDQERGQATTDCWRRQQRRTGDELRSFFFGEVAVDSGGPDAVEDFDGIIIVISSSSVV